MYNTEIKSMKTLKYIVSVTILSVCCTITLSAQDTIMDRNVTVEREYKPIIQDAGKINSVPEVLEPTVVKTVPVYSEFNLPLNADFNIHTLAAAELQREKRREPSVGFSRIGFGNNLNTLADFAFPLINKPDLKLDFLLNHYGTFASKAHSVTKSSLSFDKYFRTFDFYAGVGGGHEYLKYYGNNFDVNGSPLNSDSLGSLSTNFPLANYYEQNLVIINRNPQTVSLTNLANDSTSETFWRFNAFTGIRSLPLSTGLRYMAEVKYNVFDARNGLREHMIQTRGGFDTEQEQNRLGIDLEMDNLMYRSDNPDLLNFWNSYTVFAMNPFYSIERDTWNIRLGVKSAFSFIHGRPFNPSADINAEWKAIPKYFSVYGGITGGYDVNTMDKMFAENRYLFTDVRVKDTYSPYEFYGGIKIKPIYNLLLDAYVDFRRIDNQYFFVNKEYSRVASVIPFPNYISTLYSNRFNVIYSGADHLKIGVRANYNLRNIINVQLKGAYNKWDVSSEAYAWNKPKWEGDLSTNVRITRNFSVDANVFVEGERYAKLGDMSVRMRPKVDINLGASYSYSNWFTFFAKVNNLINNPYQNFYGYDVQGFNVLAGVAFSF